MKEWAPKQEKHILPAILLAAKAKGVKVSDLKPAGRRKSAAKDTLPSISARDTQIYLPGSSTYGMDGSDEGDSEDEDTSEDEDVGKKRKKRRSDMETPRRTKRGGHGEDTAGILQKLEDMDVILPSCTR